MAIIQSDIFQYVKHSILFIAYTYTHTYIHTKSLIWNFPFNSSMYNIVEWVRNDTKHVRSICFVIRYLQSTIFGPFVTCICETLRIYACYKSLGELCVTKKILIQSYIFFRFSFNVVLMLNGMYEKRVKKSHTCISYFENVCVCCWKKNWRMSYNNSSLKRFLTQQTFQ